MSDLDALRDRLRGCPHGHAGWREFEAVCVETLEYLFVPPLQKPRVQKRTYLGSDRRDALFPNRIMEVSNNWGRLYHEFAARMVVFEFKNYDLERVGKDETIQTASYLNKSTGRLAILCCNRPPDQSADHKRHHLYAEQNKVILFLTTTELIEMIAMKERGDDPSDLVMDVLETFYAEHE